MARIEVQCPECGPVTCTRENLELRAFEDGETYYVFACPRCTRVVQRRADARAIEILLEEGVVVTGGSTPDEACERHDGPPFTAEDLLKFHELLQQPDWFRAVLR